MFEVIAGIYSQYELEKDINSQTIFTFVIVIEVQIGLQKEQWRLIHKEAKIPISELYPPDNISVSILQLSSRNLCAS